jgi:hypothetical protein
MNNQSVTIGNKRYRVNKHKMRRAIVTLSAGLIAVIALVVVVVHMTGEKAHVKNDNLLASTAVLLTPVEEVLPAISVETPISSVIDEKDEVEVDATIVVPTKPSIPVASSKTRFVTQASALFPKVPKSYFEQIFVEAKANNIPPYFSLGIAWQESRFKKGATGPKTKFGTARGLYQVIETTARQFGGIKDPQKLYQPEIAVEVGNKVLGTYRDWLSGDTRYNAPDVFEKFSVKNGSVYFKDEPILDQNGKHVPLLVLTAISYNGGPGVISAALKRDGHLVIDPKSENCNIPMQSLDYVIQISKFLYDFEYDFSYTVEDIDRAKIF